MPDEDGIHSRMDNAYECECAETVEITNGSTCPVCNKGKVHILGPLIACAYCGKAWLPYELQAELYALAERRA